ncbi:MAG: ATP phosphoribosyltransferase [Dehalococcoidia bacterium]|nr:MAG: ATP phosphoribosyltransferase [Dehalococcoidia bacterium]
MIRLAVPTGDLRRETAALLDAAGLGIADYAAGSRSLRFPMLDGAAVARVFREKDIPVQVALGNYDAGICSLSWVEELAQRFPGHEVVRVCDLGYGGHALWLASAGDSTEASVRIVSDYPQIAETIARRMRLRRYRVFPVWGAAEAYPPEDADVALIAAGDAAAVESHGLRPLARLLDSSAWLIVNKRSLASRDLSPLLTPVLGLGRTAPAPALAAPATLDLRADRPSSSRVRLRLALPDGHAQSHTIAALRAAGIGIDGYADGAAVRRPRIDADGVDVKVIRPQDMPQQVAIGQFDLAVTGRDWLFDHLVQFPSSPVEEVVDLRRSRYGLAAIVKDVRADTVGGALREWRARSDAPIRVASEYPNIADHFARARQFGRYSVIPIAGASEGFVPDDAEILIEGIETGSSVRANKLTVLERFFESTNCVIANKRRPDGPLRPVFDGLVEHLRAGAAEAVPAGGA